MAYEGKASMLARGKELAARFCAANGLSEPAVEEVAYKDWKFGVCAYYRRSVTTICVQRCAAIGTAGMQWSYPGYTVDRTPYGVVQHELGHHVDWLLSDRKGPYFGDFSIAMRRRAGEEPITTYCPNDAEWFAEMFRLFVTNPDLLLQLRPRTHAEMAARFKPVFEDSWRERLAGAPDRTILAAERKIEAMPARPGATKKESIHASDQHPLL